jgi:small subunit ribosomal protein S6
LQRTLWDYLQSGNVGLVYDTLSTGYKNVGGLFFLMNTYEALVILKPSLDTDNSEILLKKLENQIVSFEGKIIKRDKVGRKRLAYEIKKLKDGFVVNYVLQLPPDSVVKLRQACQINEDVLRFMIINRNKVDITNPAIYGRERPVDSRGGGTDPRRRMGNAGGRPS